MVAYLASVFPNVSLVIVVVLGLLELYANIYLDHLSSDGLLSRRSNESFHVSWVLTLLLYKKYPFRFLDGRLTLLVTVARATPKKSCFLTLASSRPAAVRFTILHGRTFS